MKIERIDLFQADLPYSGGTYTLSGGREFQVFDASIVRIETACGLEGWGESTPFGSSYIAAHASGVRAGIGEIAPHLIGKDPRQVERLYDVMDGALAGHLHAKTALDVAAWDIFGKAADMPCWMLLGGTTGGPMPVMSSIPADMPEKMRQNVARHRERGYLGHSVKIGALDSEGGPALDAARIEASLADRQPHEFFLVDANGGLTPETALRLLTLLPAGLDFVLEAPCASWRETLSLRSRCRVPIILDELMQADADLAQAIVLDACDGIGLKISKAGGLTPGRRQRDMARAAGLTLSVQDTVGSTIAFAAIAHLGQTVPERHLRCILDCRDMVTRQLADFDAPVANGGVRAPDTPGLGLTVDRAALGDPVASWT
ncbi:MAG: mandelate racemase/muconate lactonizing enzyme family protein [Pseudomonadota bacterium]